MIAAALLLALVLPGVAPAQTIFVDGFESGGTCAWTSGCLPRPQPRCSTIDTYLTATPTLVVCELPGAGPGTLVRITSVWNCEGEITRRESSWRVDADYWRLACE